MKKNYSKPDILFESFSISASIAAGCAFITPLPQLDKCGLPYFNWVIFQMKTQVVQSYPAQMKGMVSATIRLRNKPISLVPEY